MYELHEIFMSLKKITDHQIVVERFLVIVTSFICKNVVCMHLVRPTKITKEQNLNSYAFFLVDWADNFTDFYLAFFRR